MIEYLTGFSGVGCEWEFTVNFLRRHIPMAFLPNANEAFTTTLLCFIGAGFGRVGRSGAFNVLIHDEVR